jgi:hypothetical protein
MKARRRRLTLGERVVLAGAAVVAVALPAWLFGGAYLKHRGEALTLAGEWAIEGPPCVEISQAEFEARGLRARKGTVYEDVTFYRQFGHVQCTGLRYGGGWSQSLYPVCQFTTPKALKISTATGDRYFDIGAGQPATVAVPRGRVRCVLAANFTMARLQGRR